MYALGIDTSNYTTSAAIVDIDTLKVQSSAKKLLPVKKGECGIRQSDAVFHHTVQLPGILKEAFNRHYDIACIAVSAKPTDEEGSYMPCFLPGLCTAGSMGTVMGVPVFETTHQIGHILCATVLNSHKELLEKSFYAFHISGGTTQLVLCEPDENRVLNARIIAQSIDLKAGQGIDRVGNMLGLDFPAGAELEKLALQSERFYSKSPAQKGNDCCLSGIENLAESMIKNGEKPADVAKFAIDYIGTAVENMHREAVKQYGDLPTVYTGGVMSNTILQERFACDNTYFAGVRYSSDNACGVALYAALKYRSRYERF